LNDVLVLCYHAISDTWPAPLALPADALEEQLGTLVARGYRGTTFTRALTEPPEGRTLAVTFDDAYRSTIERALPVLSRLGLTATVFVPTNFVGAARPMSWPGIDQWLGGPHEPELACMDLDELRVLAETGWEIGSHTRSHPRLPELSPEQLAAELAGSRARLEELLGTPCRSLAYPYGVTSRAVSQATERAGYAAAGALQPYQLRYGRFTWPRAGIYRGDSARRFALKVSPLARRARLAQVRYALRSPAARGSGSASGNDNAAGA
jgi:peptidoglycan/xylan/chitin deacetylase (PgdA/CDA1 family)